MQNLERRVALLEQANPQPYRWCWRNIGETTADAIARAGFATDDCVIVFGWQEDDANT